MTATERLNYRQDGNGNYWRLEIRDREISTARKRAIGRSGDGARSTRASQRVIYTVVQSIKAVAMMRSLSCKLSCVHALHNVTACLPFCPQSPQHVFETCQRYSSSTSYTFFFICISSCGWGKIKLKLTTLPRRPVGRPSGVSGIIILEPVV